MKRFDAEHGRRRKTCVSYTNFLRRTTPDTEFSPVENKRKYRDKGGYRGGFGMSLEADRPPTKGRMGILQRLKQ